jgi:drug/metabolite transporter (DMT)-like permease
VPVLPVMAVIVVGWGAAFSGIKVLLRDLSPGALTAGRLLVAALTFCLVAAVRSPRPLDRRPGDGWRLLLLGVTGSAGYHLALNWGEERVTAGVASLLVATMPLMVTALAVAVGVERWTRAGVAGALLGMGGVGVLVVGSGQGLGAQSAAGVLVTLGAPAAYAVYTVVAKGLADRYDGVQLNLLGSWVGALIALPFALGDLGAWGRLGWEAWVWLLYLGALSTAAAYVAYVWALRSWSASAVASIVYLVPVSSLLWAWVLLGEVPSAWAVAGGALVVAGVVLVQVRGAVEVAKPLDAAVPPVVS